MIRVFTVYEVLNYDPLEFIVHLDFFTRTGAMNYFYKFKRRSDPAAKNVNLYVRSRLIKKAHIVSNYRLDKRN